MPTAIVFITSDKTGAQLLALLRAVGWDTGRIFLQEKSKGGDGSTQAGPGGGAPGYAEWGTRTNFANDGIALSRVATDWAVVFGDDRVSLRLLGDPTCVVKDGLSDGTGGDNGNSSDIAPTLGHTGGAGGIASAGGGGGGGAATATNDGNPGAAADRSTGGEGGLNGDGGPGGGRGGDDGLAGANATDGGGGGAGAGSDVPGTGSPAWLRITVNVVPMRITRPSERRPSQRRARPILVRPTLATLAGYNVRTTNAGLPGTAPTYYPMRLTLNFNGPVGFGSGGADPSAFTILWKNVGALSFATARLAGQSVILEDCITTPSAQAASVWSYDQSSNVLVDGGGVALPAFSGQALRATGPTYPLYIGLDRTGARLEVRYMRDFAVGTAYGDSDGTWDIYTNEPRDWINNSGVFLSMSACKVVVGVEHTATSVPPFPHSSWIGIDELLDEDGHAMGDLTFFPVSLVS